MRSSPTILSTAAVVLLTGLLAGCASTYKPHSSQSNGESLYPPISYNGRFVAFFSEATNLVDGDRNQVGDVFVRDMRTGSLERTSVDSDGREGNLESTFPSLSGNGRYVAFTSSATNLVADDTNRRPDVFVHDRDTGTTLRASVGSSGEQGSGVSYTYHPAISENGDRVAFASASPELVSGDTNGTWDVFVHDRRTGTTTMVSRGHDAGTANGPSVHAVISGNGRFVAFQSEADNLVEDDTNEASDVFVHDLETGITRRVSTNAAGGEARGPSTRPAISHDGTILAFSSTASNLIANGGTRGEQVFIRNLKEGGMEIASGATIGSEPRLNLDTGETICCLLSTACCVVIIIQDRKSVVSPDGDVVAFRSDASTLVAGDGNFVHDIFVYDRGARATSRVSVGTGGIEGNRDSIHHGLSFDGRYVAFSSEATNLVKGDTNGHSDIFVHDRETGVTTLVSVPGKRKFKGRY